MNSPLFTNEENRREVWLLVAAGLALCIEILALLYQLRLVSLPGLRPAGSSPERVIGSVTLREKNVTSRAPSSLSWYPVAAGDKVHRNETVMTGSGARLKIELEGATELLLEGDTLIRFSDERKWTGAASVVDLEVNQGVVRVKSRMAPVRVAVKNRRIDVAPDSEVLLEKAALRSEAQLQVAKGKAVVVEETKQEEGVTIKEGDRVSLPESVGAVAPPLPAVLKLASREPKAGAKIFAKTEVDDVHFTWDGTDGDALEWDTADDFQTLKTQPASGEARLGLRPGKYFWRIRRGTRVSEPAELVLVPPIRYEFRAPASNAVFKRKQRVRLEWAAVEGASGYRIEVSPDESFANLAFERELAGTSVELPQLDPGTFHWRVTASSETYGAWPPSETKRFSVKSPLAAPKAKGVKMLPGGKGSWLRALKDVFAAVLEWVIPSAQAAEEPVQEEEAVLAWQFSWGAIEGAAGYRVEIAIDAKFKKVVAREELTQTNFSLTLPPGKKYYWRVAAFDEDKEVGDWSRVEKLEAPNGRVQKTPVRLPAYVKQDPPRPKALPRSSGLGFLLPSWVRLGAGGGYVMESVSSSTSSIQSNGLPLGKFALYLHRTLAGSELELGLSFQRLKYQTKDAAISAFQPDLLASTWSAHLLYKGVGWLEDFPVTAGVSVRSVPDLQRVAEETASRVYATSGSVLVGISPWQKSDAASFRQWDLLLEATPFGNAKGAGLWLRGRWGIWNQIKPLTAELQFLLHPAFRKFTSGDRSQLSVETEVALVIGGLFDVSPRWVD